MSDATALDLSPWPSGWRAWSRELAAFTWQELACCAFPLSMIALVALSSWFRMPWIPRYDLVLLCAIGIQWLMVRIGYETIEEVKIISAFHLLGLALEIFKVNHGSWSYPEFAYTKVFGAPLYSGFMYASVSSYMLQAWRRFDLSFDGLPPLGVRLGLAGAIYANFFLSHYIGDFRLVLLAILLIAYGRSSVQFQLDDRRYRMPLPLSFLLIGGFVWIAENLGTFVGAWVYPHQAVSWDWVKGSKIVSWALLVIVNFSLVVDLRKRFAKTS